MWTCKICKGRDLKRKKANDTDKVVEVMMVRQSIIMKELMQTFITEMREMTKALLEGKIKAMNKEIVDMAKNG